MRRLVVALLGCLMLAGCSVTIPPEESPSVTTPVITPSQGRPLERWGFTHHPASLVWLPSGTTLTYTADQPNLLIAVGSISQAPGVEAYLRETLPGLGWEITSETDGAVIFVGMGWQGAYVQGVDYWALTVRND